MIETHVIELINKEVDGVASAEETANLKSILSENPDARKLFAEMHSIVYAMADIVPVDPPQTLKPAIMRALDSRIRQKRPANRLTSLFHAIRTAIFARPGIVFAVGLAAGFLLFVLTSDLLAPRSVDDSELTGTLAFKGPVAGFSRGSLIDINIGGVKGSIETQFSPGLCLLRVRLDSREPISTSILTEASSVHIEAVRPSDDSGGQFSIRDGEVTLGSTKSGGVVILFSGKGKPLAPARFSLVSSGKLVFEARISLEKTD